VTGEGYGGLEHRSSSALLCSRHDLPRHGEEGIDEGYRSFLGLCSHEYFHLWNVKRIRPEVFSPCDLERESYTRQLWAFEGITSYYDDLALRRCGLISAESYLELIGRTITRVWRGAGRFRQSVAESSFDAWIKFYRQDENSPNAIVSYYAKGALIALALDLTIRLASGGQRSLDHLMRLLWQEYGKSGRGVPATPSGTRGANPAQAANRAPCSASVAASRKGPCRSARWRTEAPHSGGDWLRGICSAPSTGCGSRLPIWNNCSSAIAPGSR